jgi:hypothetical protein
MGSAIMGKEFVNGGVGILLVADMIGTGLR